MYNRAASVRYRDLLLGIEQASTLDGASKPCSKTNRPCTNDVPVSPFLRAFDIPALKGISKLRGISRVSESEKDRAHLGKQ